jgi:hypothetical protein
MICRKEQESKVNIMMCLQVMLARAKRKRLFDRIDMERMLEAMPSLNAIYREGLLHQATELMLEQYRKVLERVERD